MRKLFSCLMATLLLFAWSATTLYAQGYRKLSLQECKEKAAPNNGILEGILAKSKAELGGISFGEQFTDKEGNQILLVVATLKTNRPGRTQHLLLQEKGGRSLNLVEKPDGSLFEWNGSDLVAVDFDIRFGCLDHTNGSKSKCGACQSSINDCNRVGHSTVASRIQCILKVLDSSCRECKDDYFNIKACLFQ
jgi:hypothetical protein